MSLLDASLIADVPPFRGINRENLVELLSKAKSERYEIGRTIFCQGEEAHSFFLLLDGHVRVIKVTPEGDQVIARYISNGELFGIAHALGLERYPANAVTAVDCVMLSWPGKLWGTIIEKYPTFATNTYQTVGSRLQETQNKLVEMATKRVEQRVANAILKLANQTGRKTDEGILIDFPISRQNISEMTGTTLHTVSRILSAWENKGIVKSGRKKITVTEDHQLALLAAGELYN
ncbi:Crp/Fnr family transcriptional regulator [Sneathiella litorea]|uniref:Cyclic nucleotide-binding domain-containing protein n=1 Tax=Sneathiella litorea TaxID=2606216 RepID=A0A6L8W7Z3_9PROT|nr:Crp/Fnr family transcriptional regulator [Sneathiella litorea]MZR30769.1 cyclic nucleotide-binding domain-containing protein [Sneathiella litorea]